MKSFWGYKFIREGYSIIAIEGRSWSISLTILDWSLQYKKDSIGRFIRFGPILFEYSFLDRSDNSL